MTSLGLAVYSTDVFKCQWDSSDKGEISDKKGGWGGISSPL